MNCSQPSLRWPDLSTSGCYKLGEYQRLHTNLTYQLFAGDVVLIGPEEPLKANCFSLFTGAGEPVKQEATKGGGANLFIVDAALQ